MRFYMHQIFWANLHGLGWAACHQTAQAQHQTPTLACCSCSMNSEMSLSGSTIQGHWFLRLVKFIFFFVGPPGGILWFFFVRQLLKKRNLIFGNILSSLKSTQKWNFQVFIGTFSKSQNFWWLCFQKSRYQNSAHTNRWIGSKPLC